MRIRSLVGNGIAAPLIEAFGFWERSYKSRPMERVPPAAPATAAALPCSSPLAAKPSRACKLMEPPAPAIASVCTPEVRNWSISPRAPETSIKEPDSRMRLPLFALNSTVPASSILPLRKPSALSLRICATLPAWSRAPLPSRSCWVATKPSPPATSSAPTTTPGATRRLMCPAGASMVPKTFRFSRADSVTEAPGSVIMDAPARMVRLPNPWGLNALVEASVRFTGLRNNSSNIPMRLKAEISLPVGWIK